MKLSPPIRPSDAGTSTPAAPPRRRPGLWQRLGIWRWYLLFVVAPTAALAVYYVTYASDIYVSEARFYVRSRQIRPSADLAMNVLGGTARASAEETRAVAEYIDSHDAVRALRRSIDLVEIWRRPEADLIARLQRENPQAERLLRYYRRRVTATVNHETGITTLQVQAFRPGDAQAIALRLLDLSEELVNRFSDRTEADTLRVARQEVEVAERRVVAARDAVEVFREREREMDPARTVAGAVDSISRLEALLVQTRAELTERLAFMRPDNPQVQVLRNRTDALQQQIAAERSRVTQGNQAFPAQVSAYERLQLERAFADNQLTSAIRSLEGARAEAQRQHVFLMRVVEPNLAERALYPKVIYNTVTVFLVLTLLFGLGWLIAAGAREHAS